MLEKDLSVDFRAHWQPTADNLFSRMNANQLITWGKTLMGDSWSTDYAKLTRKKLAELFHDFFNQSGDSHDKQRARWLPECWLNE